MINTIDHIINIDLATKINMNQSINIKQNDNNSHKFVINIFNNLVVYDLAGTTSRIYFQKADNTKVFLDCVLDDALTGNISCLLTTQVLSYSGLVGSEITIYGSTGEILTSVTFNFIVSNVIRDDLTIESTSEFTALTDALAVVTNIENKLDITEYTIFKDSTVVSLANNVKQLLGNNLDYVDYLKKSATLSHYMTVRMGNPIYKYLLVNVPTSDVDGIQYQFGKDTTDDYQLLQNGDYGTLLKTETIIEMKNNTTELMEGVVEKAYAPNYWTSQIGNWIACEFTGTKIAFNVNKLITGGLWTFILDEGKLTEQTIDVSCYATVQTFVQTVLFSNLDNVKHTVKGTFMGQDPANPIASPRGYWYFGGTREQDTKRTFEVFGIAGHITPTVKCMYDYTVKEVALSCRPFESTDVHHYIPEHDAPTAYKLEEPILLIDGKEPIWTEGLIYDKVECVQLIQKLKGIYPGDDANPLMEINIIHTIKDGVVSISGKIKFLRKTHIDVGYAMMQGYMANQFNKIKTGLGDVYTVKTDGTSETLLKNNEESSFIIVNNTTTNENLAMAMTVDNKYSTKRIDELNVGNTFIEHRNTTMGKIYMRQFEDATMEIGDEYRFDGRYIVCKIPKINQYIL